MLEVPAAEDAVQEFVREKPFARLICSHPLGKDGFFNSAHRFHFRYARVGDAVHVPVEERFLLGRREIAVVRDPLVKIVSDEIKHVLFQIRAGATDRVNLVAPDHFSQRQTKLRGAHCTPNRHKHPAARSKMSHVGISRVLERSGVEMPEMMRDKGGYRALRSVCRSCLRSRSFLPDRRRVMSCNRR